MEKDEAQKEESDRAIPRGRDEVPKEVSMEQVQPEVLQEEVQEVGAANPV
jgi:hypothetical protein